MAREWECRTCGTTHAAQGTGFQWKCAGCGALRRPGLVWGGAALAGVLLITGIWVLLPGQSPDERYLTRLKAFLQGDARTEGEISPEEQDQLKVLATHLRISNRADELTRKGKQDFLRAKQEALRKHLSLPAGQDIAARDLQPLCELARRMDLLGAVAGCTVTAEGIQAHLTRGEFGRARESCRSAVADAAARRLCSELDMPLTAEVSLQVQKDGSSASIPRPLDAPELSRLVLTNRDNYRLLVSLSLDRAFLYIFQKDHFGEIKRLFPDPVWSRGVDNPIQRGNLYQLPSEREWYYLDELPADRTDTIRESLIVVASPWRAEDIEQLYGKIHEATTADGREDRIHAFMKQVRLRNDPAVKSLFYREYQFDHGK